MFWSAQVIDLERGRIGEGIWLKNHTGFELGGDVAPPHRFVAWAGVGAVNGGADFAIVGTDHRATAGNVSEFGHDYKTGWRHAVRRARASRRVAATLMQRRGAKIDVSAAQRSGRTTAMRNESSAVKR